MMAVRTLLVGQGVHDPREMRRAVNSCSSRRPVAQPTISWVRSPGPTDRLYAGHKLGDAVIEMIGARLESQDADRSATRSSATTSSSGAAGSRIPTIPSPIQEWFKVADRHQRRTLGRRFRALPTAPRLAGGRSRRPIEIDQDSPAGVVAPSSSS